jgi:phosphate transport system permease protein
VPYRTKEAAYGMGATRWEAILKIMLPTAAGGIASALILGLGRALGETMALAMLIGNSNQVSLSLFAPANTLASLIASNFPEAAEVERQALMYAARSCCLPLRCSSISAASSCWRWRRDAYRDGPDGDV